MSDVDHRSPVVEDYAKTIYSPGVDGAGPVATIRLAERLGVTIAAKLGDPTRDPHGDPIPSEGFLVEERATRSLDDLAAGESGRFVRVSDADPVMLRYLAERSISPGARLEVLDRQPSEGPLRVRFEGGEVQTLGGELTRARRVEVDE